MSTVKGNERCFELSQGDQLQEALESAERLAGVVPQAGNRLVTFDQQLVTQIVSAEAIRTENFTGERCYDRYCLSVGTVDLTRSC